MQQFKKLGKNGENGRDGQLGRKGENGHAGSHGRHGFGIGGNGHHGERGGNANSGTHGTHGENGVDAKNGKDIHILLEGDVMSTVVVTGEFNYGGAVCEMFCVSEGGNGGNGGNGGRGGDGGSGGHGGTGGCGSQGKRGNPGADGERGGMGGNGGDGGDAGHGGNGGNGGRGGNGGNGGSIFIDTTNPYLLNYIEAKSIGGKAGSNGQAGSGGKGGPGGSHGDGGHGGKGGDPGDPITITKTLPDNRIHTEIKRFRHGPEGTRGYKGKNGNSGSNGQSGQNGSRGVDGVSGTVMYRVLDPFTRMMIEQSATKYKLKVIDFTIVPVIDDGVIEPGEELIVKNFVIKNDGGLTAPVGAQFSLASLGLFVSRPMVFTLHQPVLPGQIITITDHEFNANVNRRLTMEPQNFGSFSMNVQLNIPASYYDKKHSKGCEKFLTAKLPIAVEYVHCTRAIDKYQRGSMKIGVKNLATLAYGSMSGAMTCQVGLRIDFDPRMTLFSEIVPHATLVQPNSIYIDVPNLMALSTLEHNLEFAFTDTVNYFDVLYYSISLIYKGEEIEKHLMDARMAPSYMPSPQGENTFDVIFFTNSHINNVEFLNYMKIFEGLGLRVNFWDIEINRGLSFVNNDGITRHPISWVNDNQGKLLIFPMATDIDYQFMLSSDVVNIIKPHTENKLQEGGIILVGNTTNQQYIPYLRTCATEVKIPDDAISDSYVISKPTREHLAQKSGEYVSKVPLSKPAQNIVLGRQLFNPTKVGSFKTLLGEAYYLELGLLANANCYAINSVSTNFLSQQSQSPNMSTLTGMGLMIMSIIMSLPLSKLLYILRNPTDWLKNTKFYNEYRSVEQRYYDLIACSLYCKIYHSIILNTKLDDNLNFILQEFEKQLSSYEKNPEKIAICEALLLAFHHLGSQIKWKVSLFKSLSQKDSFDKFMETFSQLLSKIIGDPNHAKNFKKNLPTLIKELGRENYLHVLASIHRLVYDQCHKTLENEIRKKENTGLFSSVSTDSPVNYLD